LEQVQLILADLLGAEQVGGTAEVKGEAGDVRDVTRDGTGGVIAALEILGKALA
jgi:hypothetical protein